MNRFITYAALCRAILLARLVVTVAAVAVGIRLIDDGWRTIGVLALLVLATAGEFGVLTRWPSAVRWRLSALALDAALAIGVLVLSSGGVAFFCYAAGSAALGGVLLGTSALPLWIADTGLGLAVAAYLLRSDGGTDGQRVIAPFVLAFPMTDIVCGLGAAAVTAAVVRYIEVSVAAVAAAQRSAATDERARLARELHDSVAKTLHGVSFAALALPFSLHRHPDLAEQLAATVSEGADTAVREARELLAALRRDVPDRPFADNVADICRAWTDSTGIPVTISASAVEPPLAARYELIQILHEALRNAERHARAHRVRVGLGRADGELELRVEDDGAGFRVPADLNDLSSAGNFGIVGMSERARAVGGVLRVNSSAGAGTSVVARVRLAHDAGTRVASRTSHPKGS